MLEDYENNVVDWIEDLSNLMRVCNIKDPERIFTWASEAVDSNTKAVLRRLINKRTGVYPSLKEIQKAVEEHLGITEGDKLTYLQGLKIKENETIKTFNDRYRRLYHDLSRDYQKIVSVKTYRNAIKSRNFAYSQVFMSKCDSLNEAYEIAETAEEAEKEWNKPDNNNSNEEYQIRTTNNKRNIRNLSMLTQNTSFPRRNRNPTFNYFNSDLRNNYQQNNSMINNNNWNTNNNEYSFNNSNNISLMDGFEEYLLEDLVDKVADTEVGTKLVHLFDLFPKFRSAFQKKLKLKPKTTSKTITKESVITNAVNVISENKISKVYGQIEGQNGEIFLDSCASINMVTRAALKKYKINKKPVGNITEMILQAYINTTMSSDIYELEISIGPVTFKDYFRVIEKDDLFELLIGVDSLKKHKLILNFNDDTLYTTDKNNFPIRLAPIYYDLRLNADEENNEISEEVVDVDASKPLNITVSLVTANEESLDNKETRVKKIINLIPKLVKDPVPKLFEDFKDILTMKADDLKPTKLLPHRIMLKPGSKSVKQRAYRLSKIQAKALKKKLEKLNYKIIVVSVT